MVSGGGANYTELRNKSHEFQQLCCTRIMIFLVCVLRCSSWTSSELAFCTYLWKFQFHSFSFLNSTMHSTTDQLIFSISWWQWVQRWIDLQLTSIPHLQILKHLCQFLNWDAKHPHPLGHSNLGRFFFFFLRRERDCGEGKVQMDDWKVSLSLKSEVTLKSDKNY